MVVAAPGLVPRPGLTYAFRRPLSRVIVDLIGPPVGAIVFLGGAWLMLTGRIPSDSVDPFGWLMLRVVAPLFFGFFGLLMASSVPAMLRRGVRRTVLRIGPHGMWTPEMGVLAWDEIADVRLEQVRGFGGHHPDAPARAGRKETVLQVGGVPLLTRTEQPASTSASYPRLGIYPTDASLTSRVRDEPTWRMLRWMEGVTRTLSPRSRFRSVDDMAPFGVFSYELAQRLEDAVAVIRLYRDVVVESPAAAGVVPSA